MAVSLILKLAITPLLITAASLAGRRWGDRLAGWLVALPLTSGPVALLVAIDHGTAFAARASVGMLVATTSQVVFALGYRALARRGRLLAFATGCVCFAVVTAALAWAGLPLWPAVAVVAIALAAGVVLTRRPPRWATSIPPAVRPPRWDMPLRIIVATTVVFAATSLAPVIGPYFAGLLSPFPIFGVVLALFAHTTRGGAAAVAAFDGLLLGLAAPAAFFLALSVSLPGLGFAAFLLATAAALATQAATMLALHHSRRTASAAATHPADNVPVPATERS